MSFTAIYSVVVVFSALFFVGWYLLSRWKRSAPAKPEEPRRWHKWFDEILCSSIDPTRADPTCDTP